MRKVILSLAVSVDGYIEGPNGEYDWCLSDQDYGMTEFFKRIDTILMGRKSYELIQTQQAGKSKEQGPYSALKSIVFSNTLKTLGEGFELAQSSPREVITALKKKEGKDFWLFGGSGLTTSFINDGLIDEMVLAVHPIILGAGTSLFQNIRGRIPLKLIESKPYNSGLVMLKYST